jgi:hypothetical protein
MPKKRTTRAARRCGTDSETICRRLAYIYGIEKRVALTAYVVMKRSQNCDAIKASSSRLAFFRLANRLGTSMGLVQ